MQCQEDRQIYCHFPECTSPIENKEGSLNVIPHQQTDRQTNNQTNKATNEQSNKHINKPISKQKHKQTQL